VVLLDLCLPDLSGAEVTRRLAAQHPAAQVLVLSSTYAPDQVQELFAAGARGYALKSVGMAELVHGIRTVADGRRFLCTGLGLAALKQVAQCPTRDRTISAVPPAGPLRALTNREQEVLRLLAEGCSNQEMADRLFTSKRTVETHRQNLIAKSQAKNSAALVKLATSQGWLH
jgi:DNA-binding NarL/FixJ family response regulator